MAQYVCATDVGYISMVVNFHMSFAVGMLGLDFLKEVYDICPLVDFRLPPFPVAYVGVQQNHTEVH